MRYSLIAAASLRATWLVAASLLVGTSAAQAQQKLAPIPSATVRVNDNASMLTEGQAANLDRLFEDYERQHRIHLLLLTVSSTAPEEIDRYTERVAEVWKIGQPGGAGDVMIVVARSNPGDLGRIRIIGRTDLQSALPDTATGRIIVEDMLPRFESLDYYGGLVAGIDHVKALLAGGTLPTPVAPVAAPKAAAPLLDRNVVIAGAICVAVVLLLMLQHATRRRMCYLAGDRAVNRAFKPMIVGGFVGRSRHVSARGDNGFGGGFVGPGVGGYAGGGGDFSGGNASAKW